MSHAQQIPQNYTFPTKWYILADGCLNSMAILLNSTVLSGKLNACGVRDKSQIDYKSNFDQILAPHSHQLIQGQNSFQMHSVGQFERKTNIFHLDRHIQHLNNILQSHHNHPDKRMLAPIPKSVTSFRPPLGGGWVPAQFLLLEMGLRLIYLKNEGVMEDIECVFESMSASGSIYISNIAAAQNLALLQEKRIKAVLSVARSGLLGHKREEVPHYLYIPVEDHEDYQIDKYFDQTFDFIEKARKETNVLIHCMVGVSRSVTIAIAYLLKKYKYTLGQVISLIQRKRRKINPNPGFIEQLRKYSEKLGIKCDFHGNEVPIIKERSASKQKRNYSAKKERTPVKVAEPLTPIVQIDKESNRQKISISSAFYLEEKSQGAKWQCLEMKKFKSHEEKSKANEEEEFMKIYIHEPKEKVIEMDKTAMTEGSKERRRSSIEEKISKIREKILKSDRSPGKSIKKSVEKHSEKKENIQLLNKTDKLEKSYRVDQSSNISHLRKSPPIKPQICQERPKLTHKPHSVQRRNNDFVNYCKQQRSRQLFSSQLRIEPKTFYSNGFRPNSRLSIRTKEESTR